MYFASSIALFFAATTLAATIPADLQSRDLSPCGVAVWFGGAEPSVVASHGVLIDDRKYKITTSTLPGGHGEKDITGKECTKTDGSCNHPWAPGVFWKDDPTVGSFTIASGKARADGKPCNHDEMGGNCDPVI